MAVPTKRRRLWRLLRVAESSQTEIFLVRISYSNGKCLEETATALE